MRDSADNALVVCGINFDSWDSGEFHCICLPKPCQTMKTKCYVTQRSIRALKIEGGCNVQLALDPHSFKYYVK